MKKTIYYIVLMLLAVIVLPTLIVGSCNVPQKMAPQEKELPSADKTDKTNKTNKTGKIKGLTIKVYIAAEKKVVQMPLEEYIKGVVAAEMPAEFEPEALKAQAVAARTYALSRMQRLYSSKEDVHAGADICTDPSHCQAWVDKNTAMKRWRFFSAYRYWNKIDKAVNDTCGEVIVYQGTLINPVFHSNSGGRTESSENVWQGVAEPYLRSVVSDGEESSPDFKMTVNIKTKDFINKLKAENKAFKINSKSILNNIKVLSYTEGGRVKYIKVGNITLKGTDVRRIFSLKSANFKVEKGENETLKITTTGNGHGVGMSQWGANYLAKNGGNYEEILKYYYQGIALTTIEKLGQ